MGFKYKLEKILVIKESEKDKAIGEYNEASLKFEEAATRLYNFLKQKEDLESYQDEQIQMGLNIQKIQQLQRFLENLQKSIDQCQIEVAKARHYMELKEKTLLEKNVEVKKFEKMKENARISYESFMKAEETKFMDEISIQQYMNRGN